MVSHDLERWETRPPLFAPRRYWDLECPQVFSLGGDRHADRWRLTAAIVEDRTQRYWTASQPAGPFHVPPGGDLLAPAGHYAARIACWKGMDLLFAWRQPRLQDGWLTSPKCVDWVEARNPFGKFLAPPLVLSARGDGCLTLAPFPVWDGYRDGDWRAPRPEQRTLSGDIAPDSDSARRIETDGVMDVLPPVLGDDDFVVEGSIELDAARGGLAPRLDGDGRGLYLELHPGSRQVSLQRWGTKQSGHAGSLSYAYDELQATQRTAPVKSREHVPFRLLSVGPYVEASIGGEVVIATMTGRPRSGQWGIWVEDGSCTVSGVRWASMRQPATAVAPRSTDAVEEASVG